MPNAATLSSAVETATKCWATASFVVGVREAVEQPRPAQPGVGERLEGAEGLAGDDEQGAGGVQAGQRGGRVGRVDVADEAALETVLPVGGQRLVGHHRTEVRAADPDVDHGTDPFAGGPGPAPVADLLGELVDPSQHLVDLRHHVRAVDLEVVPRRTPERGVQHRPVLGGVDVLPGEHRVAPLLEPHLGGQVQQRVEDVPVDQCLGQVDVQIACLEGQPVDPLGIVGEPGAQIGLELVSELLESCPCLGGRGVAGSVGHCLAASRFFSTVSSSSFHDVTNFSTPSSSRVLMTSS